MSYTGVYCWSCSVSMCVCVFWQADVQSNDNIDDKAIFITCTGLTTAATTCESSSKTSPASSVYSDEHSSLHMTASLSNRYQRSNRNSVQVVRRALVRTTSCFLPRSKSADKGRYFYGMSEESNESGPDVAQTASTSMTKRSAKKVEIKSERVKFNAPTR